MRANNTVAYINISTSTTVLTSPGYYYGFVYISGTTGPGKVLVMDAAATAAGTVVHGGTASGGTNLSTPFLLNYGVACRTGIHVNAISCTTAADQIVVFYESAPKK